MSARVLLIDNYDSFTYNLAHLFGELGAEVVVRRNDAITADEAEALAPSHLVVSPGPGPARRTRASRRRSCARLSAAMPTLGVCLGHQAIVEVFGGEIGAARELVHGKATDRPPRRPRPLRRAAGGLPRRPLPLARGDVDPRRASRSRRPRPTAR